LKWLKEIFKKGSSQDRSAKLELSDLGAWLDEKSGNTLSRDTLQEIYSGIEEVGKDLTNDIKALASAEPNESTPPRLLKAGLAARGEVVKQIDAFSRKLATPKQMDAESVTEHHWTMVKGLNNAVQKYGRAQRYVAALFPRESEAINSDFNRLSRLLVQLEEEIGKNRKEREEIWYSRDLVTKIPQEFAEIRALSDQIKRDDQKLSELQDFQRLTDTELKRLASSEEGQKIEELKKSLIAKREELKEIESEIDDLVSPLTKALSRAMKQESSDRISLQHREVLEKLSRSPLKALDGDISEPLKEVRSHMAVLGLKDRKKEKVLDHLDYLIDKKPLESLKSRHVKLQNEVGNLEKLLADATGGTVLLNKDLLRTRKEIERLDGELTSSRQTLAVLEEKASRDEAELKERIAKISGGPVEIDMGFELGE
jgi:hypothetical protein